MKTHILLLILLAFAMLTTGCRNNAGYTVDKNDPSSVENASKQKPVLMNSDGTPYDPNQAGAPPPQGKP